MIIPSHQPALDRLGRTLDALRSQSLSPARWNALLVDNASVPALERESLGANIPENFRIVREPELGLTAARRTGIRETRGDIIVFVDDDNVLAPDYLELTLRLFKTHSRIGALGGKSIPEFEQMPPDWVREFDGLLACRDLGDKPQVSSGLRDPQTGRNAYPHCAPLGAGMAVRRAAVESWLATPPTASLTDRRGSALTSGGDNDISLTLMQNGWEVGYFPELALTHLIPAGRVDPDYLARLNRGIAQSWIHVLAKHDANPWPSIPGWTVSLRQLKAWFTYRAWSHPAAYVRWQGACGHFEGLASLDRSRRS